MRIVLLKILRNQHGFMLLRSVSTPLTSLVLVALIALQSCRKFEGDQTVPAYLRIDTIFKQTDYASYGSSTHNITDAWVYVNDVFIGTFELPATFPVLAKGLNNLEIRPGIKLNGISATRVYYPFYQPVVIQDFNFVEDSIRSVSLTTLYYETTVMPWSEDFEEVSLSLEKTQRSDTTINKTQPANSQEALLSAYSAFSGVVHLKGDVNRFELATAEYFSLPGQGSPVFLEIDYKCDRPFGVGVFVEEFSTITAAPLLIVNSISRWNKIYINLGPNISRFGPTARFKVYLDGTLGDDDEARFYFDNIKLVHR
jgi:hypothetical protein